MQPRLLIVDDVPANIGVVAKALEAEYEIQAALSAEEALTLIERQPPDIVLLDVMMPGIDGLEALRRLRAAEWGREVPVILMTADDRTETQLDGLELGADDFIAKPVVLPVVRARVRNVVERRQLQRAQTDLLKRFKEANSELRRISELNAVLLASAGEGIFSTNVEGLCTSINPAALVMLGYVESEVLGRNQHTLFHHHHSDGTDYPPLDCPIAHTLRDGQQRSIDDAFIRKDGSVLPVQFTVTAMRLEGAIVGAEVIFSDISERQRFQRELLTLATTDYLTGVLNRRRLMELGEADRVRIVRYGHTSGLLMLDLDHFKSINDRHGHASGDDVLKAFAGAVSGLLRGTDLFGRIGGEEFAVLLPQTDLAGARIFAERVREAVAELRIPVGTECLQVTTSIGVTSLQVGDASFDEAMIRADRQLYVAKAAGRNRIAG